MAMTVKELIGLLQRQPMDAKVEIASYDGRAEVTGIRHTFYSLLDNKWVIIESCLEDEPEELDKLENEVKVLKLAMENIYNHAREAKRKVR